MKSSRRKVEVIMLQAAKDDAGPKGDDELSALKASLRDARLLKKLKTLKIEMDMPTVNNRFIKPFGVQDIVEQILKLKNIVVDPQLVMLQYPYSSPGLYSVPLAIMDGDQQVRVTVQLTPKEVSSASPGDEETA